MSVRAPLGGMTRLMTIACLGLACDAASEDAGSTLALAMPGPTADEQYMLELVNRARAHPVQERDRLVQLAATAYAGYEIDRAGFEAEMASRSQPLPPLAFNVQLIQAARDNSARMLKENCQRHSPDGFLDPYYRPTVGSYVWSENIFAHGHHGKATGREQAQYFHDGLMLEWGHHGYFGHLHAILNPSFREIGIGFLWGQADPRQPPVSGCPGPPGQVHPIWVGPALVTQELGNRSAAPGALTGVFYQDRDGDAFYTPGEGIGGVEVTATGSAGTFRTVSWAAGGYTLSLPPGSYQVTASGSGVDGTRTVTMAHSNVLWTVRMPGAVADRPVPADYDGNGLTEIAVYRPSTAEWFIPGRGTTKYGMANVDVPVPGRYGSPGAAARIALFRPTTAQWFIDGVGTISFGAANLDRAVPADYDGDGSTDIAVFRPTTAEWFVRGQQHVAFGWGGVDVPVPGDYDGDARADIAVYRPTTAEWFVRGKLHVPFGWAGVDIPVPADYDGDGTTDIAVYRPPTGEWFIRGSSGKSYRHVFGASGASPDVPVPGRYGHQVRASLAVFRSATAEWFLLDPKTGQQQRHQYGAAGTRGDAAHYAQGVYSYVVPVPSIFIDN